jgi:ankyrin repeat protein
LWLVVPTAMARENIDFSAKHNYVISEYRPPANLQEAVQSGTPDQVLAFLEQGANANGQMPQTKEPFLYYCLKQGELEKASYLLAHHADPYLTGISQTTIFDLALSQNSTVSLAFVLQHSDVAKWRKRYRKNSQPVVHRLAQSNQRRLLQMLLHYGWDINQADQYGNTALIEAVRQNNTAMLRYLIAQQADLYHKNEQAHDALYFAIKNQLPDALRVLLRAGINPQQRYEKNLTALMFAVTEKNLTAVQWLLRAGSDIHAVNDEGENALVLVLQRRNYRVDIFESLLKRGADANSLNKRGQSILAQAVQERCYACVDLLLAHAARVNAGGHHRKPSFDIYSWPPLFWAVSQQDPYLVEKLLAAGANIHQRRSRDQATVLFVAVTDATADANMVRLLIKHGAKVNVMDKDHWPLLVKASAHSGIAVLTALIDAGADVNKANWHGWTPLMAAAQVGSSEKASLLLKQGAHVNARSRQGWTALSEAKRAGHFDIVALLAKAGGVDPVNVQPKTRKDRGKLKIEIKVGD